MRHFSVLLLFFIVDAALVCGHVLNRYPLQKGAALSFPNSTQLQEGGEGKAARRAGARLGNPFGLAGVSEHAGPGVRLVDGDIAQPLSQSRSLFQQGGKWPEGVVPYEIDNQYSDEQKTLINGAMTKITEATNNCIRFVEKGDHPDWVRIFPGTGCNSLLGKAADGGAQDLSLENPGCVHEGTVIHELLHALGHIHEHNRPDRDEYVRINWDNVQQGMEYAFEKYPDEQVETYGFGYDYGSIMHYDSKAFSKGEERTIDTIKEGFENQVDSIGMSGTLSEWDIEKLKKRYEC